MVPAAPPAARSVPMPPWFSMSSCSTSFEELPMTFPPRTTSALFLALALPIALSACARIDDDAAAPAGADSQVESTAGIEGIDGLETAQQQAGYVIGLELGSTLF